MKKSALALALTFGVLGTAAQAQTDMSCADYLKADKQMAAQMGGSTASSDPTAAAMDKKVKDYCTANPKTKLSEAMEKALMN
jgi:hypothetical protein